MILDTGLFGATAVFGGSRGREMPLHIGRSGNQRDIVKIAYLPLISCVFLQAVKGNKLSD
jgi:hypothetical protein